MSNILLIKPSGLDKTTPEVTHPLGLMSLASYLRQAGRSDRFELIDARLRPEVSMQQTLDRVPFEPDVIALSALTIEGRSMRAYATEARQRWPRAHIVCGGPHASSYPKEIVAENDVDVTVQGEGEITFKELLDAFDRDRALDDIQGITFMRDGEAVQNAPRPFIEDLDELPWPAWDLSDIEAYAKVPCMSTLPARRYMTLFTSRACPYRCNYCHDIFGKKFHARSPENVVAEIEEIIRRYDITEFECVDDIFNIDNRRAEAICDLIIERGLDIGITFPNGLRSDRLPRPLIEKLRLAGTRTISFAIETASPRLQKQTEKRMDLDKLAQAVRDSAEVGILCTGFFMLGFPTETREELEKTVDFALKLPLHTAHFFIVTPFQGTSLASEYSDEARRDAGNIDDFHYIKGSSNMSEVDDEELSRIQRNAWVRFYMRPGRLWRLLLHYPRKRDLAVKATRMVVYKLLGNRPSKPDALPAAA